MMLKIKRLLLATVAIALITSCSQQKFAFRKKIAVDHKESLAVKPTVNVSVSSESSGTEETNFPEIASNEPATVRLAVTEPRVIKKPNHTNNAGSKLKEQPLKAKRIAEKLEKATKLTDRKNDISQSMSSLSPRQFIIIGLILLLIGIVLGIISGLLGYLVSVVGVVMIIIGLIFILSDQL